MMINVYVEGPSDRSAMEALLRPLIGQKLSVGVSIRFISPPKGDGKTYLLTQAPIRAAQTIINNPCSIVVAMPDLYPKNKAFPHETFDKMEEGIRKNFDNALIRMHAGADARLKERFKVFCFKYDLEALILASEEALKSQLGVESLKVTWRKPVEDQDHDLPPKKIVEGLFRENGKSYRETRHARLILSEVNYLDIAEKCPQCFKPFVEFLTGLQPEI